MADSQGDLLLKIQEQGDLVRKLKAAKESNERVRATLRSQSLHVLIVMLHQPSFP